MFLLDTNVCIGILNTRAGHIAERFRLYGPARIALCSVVKAELIAGARSSARVEANLHRLSIFFGPLASLPFDDRAAEHYGMIYADLRAAGAMIGPNDLKIASIARANDRVLITHNTREFARVVGLRVEDWE